MTNKVVGKNPIFLQWQFSRKQILQGFFSIGFPVFSSYDFESADICIQKPHVWVGGKAKWLNSTCSEFDPEGVLQRDQSRDACIPWGV